MGCFSPLKPFMLGFSIAKPIMKTKNQIASTWASRPEGLTALRPVDRIEKGDVRQLADGSFMSYPSGLLVGQPAGDGTWFRFKSVADNAPEVKPNVPMAFFSWSMDRFRCRMEVCMPWLR